MANLVGCQKQRLEKLASLLSDNLELLSTHPNDLNLHIIPSEWLFTANELLSFYVFGSNNTATVTIPEEIVDLISSIRGIQLSRTPIPIHAALSLPTNKGMSPKKAHEVQRMATYIKALIDVNVGAGSNDLRVVDVGAGQAYLTRTLAAHLPDARILALDADEGQTAGAQRLAKGVKSQGNIEHRTAMLNAATLLKTVDDWVHDSETTEKGANPIPVVFVALHACGSLTPDILRAVITAVRSGPTSRGWYPLAVVAVGCCYNLMYPGDYPLSRTLLSHPTTMYNPLPLSAYHLAAQIPETWLDRDTTTTGQSMLKPSVALATRKIVWRALLQNALPQSTPLPPDLISTSMPKNKSATVPARTYGQLPAESQHLGELIGGENVTTNNKFVRRPMAPCMPLNPTPTLEAKPEPSEATIPQGIGLTPNSVRLGKLPDSAYTQGWNHFINMAAKKMGVSFYLNQSECTESTLFLRSAPEFNGDTKLTDDKSEQMRDSNLERRLEMLHVLRCLLGPAVESAILLDRVCWVQEQLKVDSPNSDGDENEGGRDDELQATSDRSGSNLKIDLVNLFDQKTGSGRNVAIVLAPVLPIF